MAPSKLTVTGGGLAGIVCGLLLLAGHLLNLGGDPDYGTVLGSSLILGAHVLLVLALVALYAVQAARAGLLGQTGMVLSVLGTVMNAAAIFVEIAGANGQDVDAILKSGLTGALTTIGGVAFLIGLILFGAATMRAGILPRWSGLVLIAGDIVFGLGTLVGSAADAFYVLGAALTCAAFVWMGVSLVSRGQERAADMPSVRPA